MKTTILLLLAAVLAAFAPTTVRAADDLHVIYEEGRAAFNAGQFDLAREKLSYVLSKSPGHLPTQAMLAQIERQLGPDNTLLRKSYEKIILERIEFVDVSVEEAMQAVRMLAMKATQNKVAPNLIVKSPEIGKKNISISLAQVPLSEVLNYIAQLAGAKAIYDKSAVVITSLADVRVPTPAPVVPPTTPTVTPPPFPTGKTSRQALDRNSLPSYLRDPFSHKA